MSFRRNDQGRYGQVPPVQYPVASQAHEPQGPNRRPSFNNGDDGAYYSQNQQYAPSFQGGGSDELFMGNPTAAQRSPGRPQGGASSSSSSSHAAFSGYQHQYQDVAPPPASHSAYNPQNFAPQNAPNQASSYAPSQPQPYNPQVARSYSTSQSPTYVPHSPPQQYNPAAYATATSLQRQGTYAGYSNAGQAPNYGGATYNAPSYGQSPGASYVASFPQQHQQQATSPNGGQEGTASSSASYWNSNSHTSAYGQPSGYHPNGPQMQAPSQSQYEAFSAPYPSSSDIPVGPNYTAPHDQLSFSNRQSHMNSQRSPSGSPYMQSQPSPGLQRHPTNAPLPRRPLENNNNNHNNQQQSQPIWGNDGHDQHEDIYSNDRQESLLQDIEAELRGSNSRGSTTSHVGSVYDGASTSASALHRYNSTATTAATTVTDPVSRASSQKHQDYPPVEYDNGGKYDDDDDDNDDDDDDDDDLGQAGLEAMRIAEEEELRFSGATFASAMPSTSSMATSMNNDLPPPPEEQPADRTARSSFGGAMDLGMFSGGYAGNLAYGAESTAPLRESGSTSRPLPSSPGYNPANAPGFDNAEVDYAGTGGLQAPAPHRLSFDEGQEDMSIDAQLSGNESPSKDGYEELFYHPGLSNRPLPALPPIITPAAGSDASSLLSVNNRSSYHARSLSTDSRLSRHEGPDAYFSANATAATAYNSSLQPERSISLLGRSTTPTIVTPARSRTDAAEERRKFSRQHQTAQQQGAGGFVDPDNPMGAFDGITLPSGRKRKFVPSKLSPGDFRRCAEPWALSGIVSWLREMAEGELDLREKTVEEALIHLFTFKVTTMNVADAETLSTRVVTLMRESRILIPDEEWVKFGQGELSGVLWQMTGAGCYAPKLHEMDNSGQCYSHYCTRTVKKIDLDGIDDKKPTDEWHVFYHLKKEDLEERDPKEVERQNILHEIVTGEENYIKQLDVFRTLYRDHLRASNPPIIGADRREKFVAAVFGKLDSVIAVNKDNLLAQLKYRQKVQGPWITGFSDIFREWIRKAKSEYIEYATGYPRATWMVRKESDRNIYFKKFLEEQQRHKSASKKDWTNFLIAPLQRLQRYILLLETAERKMKEESEEKTNLSKAIGEIKVVTLECDAKVEETNRRVEMMELNRMLVLRPGFQSVLNLDHLGRELIIQGDLTRMGSKGVRWVDTHALLFDHYLILAKEVTIKDGRGEKKYDVSREPIPMPLLFLESMNDEPVIKQKGLTAPLGRAAAAPMANTLQLSKIASNNSNRPALEHTVTSSSVGSGASLTPLGTGTDAPEGKILYPFRIKHLGHEVYTLYASSAKDRSEWCTKIIEAKTRHAKALFQQNAEPFRLRVLSDASFSYDATSIYSKSMGVPVKGTPLDRAIENIESILGSAQGIAPVCRAQVNCAIGFMAFGKQVIAIGTDYGVFISEPSSPRGWTRTVQATRVTQIAVLEDFSVCILIADRSLISYSLDVIAPVSDFSAPSVSDNSRKAPQRLAKDVTYFATAKMKERTLVFYKRKESLHTSFKVLEPILNKATEKRSRFGLRKGGAQAGSTETFRDYDEFFFPIECYSLSLFQTYIAVCTAKGIEMLTLDKKQPISIPDLKQPAIANIANRIKDQKPLGMFRLNDNEFLLAYEDCAVYVDKHGDVSRTLIMEYTGKQKKARGATMFGPYLLLFNDDYVEVRNAENGRLRQIIAGRDVRLIDYGVRGPAGGHTSAASHYAANGSTSTNPNASKGTVKIAMSHPELPGRQIILEMLLNDGHTET